jgi:transcriptional regulator with XRE-family HTH domain
VSVPTFDHDRLRAARKDADVSREQVCADLGVAMKTVYRWERGDSEPLLSQAARLADLLGIELHELVRR